MSSYIIIGIVLLHIVVGFAYFIWKIEFQGKKGKTTTKQIDTKSKKHASGLAQNDKE